MKDCKEIIDCVGRREFLVKTASVAGGLILTLSAAGSVFGIKSFEDLVVPIDDASPLNKIGGSNVVSSTAGKIIILRTGETTFAAFSAKCTHKGTTIGYDPAKKQFKCPNHGSTFDTINGNRTGGPASEPLKQFAAKALENSVAVEVGR